MKSTPPSASSPRGARTSLPRLSIPPPCTYDSCLGAPLLISPRRLTGALSPKARASSEFGSTTTTVTTTNAAAARSCSTTSSLSGRPRRTTSDSNEAISILESALAEFKARVKAAREEKATAAAAAAAAAAAGAEEREASLSVAAVP